MEIPGRAAQLSIVERLGVPARPTACKDPSAGRNLTSQWRRSLARYAKSNEFSIPIGERRRKRLPYSSMHCRRPQHGAVAWFARIPALVEKRQQRCDVQVIRLIVRLAFSPPVPPIGPSASKRGHNPWAARNEEWLCPRLHRQGPARGRGRGRLSSARAIRIGPGALCRLCLCKVAWPRLEFLPAGTCRGPHKKC